MRKMKKLNKMLLVCFLLAWCLLPGAVWADEAAPAEAGQPVQAAEQPQPGDGSDNPGELKDAAETNQTGSQTGEPTEADDQAEATDPTETVDPTETTDPTEPSEQTEPTEQPPVEQQPTGSGIDPVLNQVKLTIDSKWALVRGQSQQIDAAPFSIDGTTMLPLRFIAQDILDAQVVWDEETKLVRVERGQLSLLLDLAAGTVQAGDQPYAMAQPPTVVDGRTYIPLRLITELMDCQVQYNPEDHSILITLPVELEPLPPVADITYQPATAGQTIQYADYSYDPQNLPIVERLWEVTDIATGQTKSGESLYWLFYQKQGGDYTISYKVKNSLGLWSEPVIMDYRLEVNRPPEITRLSALNMDVAIGQRLDITYLYDNEEWEELSSIYFTYSWEDDQGKKITKLGKPAAFFRPGKHTVSLRLQDAFGQWSETAELTFDVQDKVMATEAEFRFHNLNPGEIFLNLAKYNFNNLAPAQTTGLQQLDVTLLDSNSPEKVNGPGLLYKDTATGNVAVHYHHLNNTAGELKFYMIAHNETEAPITFTIGKMGFAGPSQDPMQVGYIENQSYLSSQPLGRTVTLQPGEKYLLNADQKTAVKPAYLQSGLVDIYTEGQLTLAVAAMYPDGNFRNYTNLQPVNSVGPQTRGSYQKAAYDINITLGAEGQKIMLGYPDSFGGWISSYLLKGVDAMTGGITENKGNYGMVQTLHLTATERTGLLINPRGSIYRGALLFNGELCLLSATDQIQTNHEGVIIGIIEAGQTATVTYITPDGSDSPVLLVALPEKEWKEH